MESPDRANTDGNKIMTEIATHESPALQTAEAPPVPAYLQERYAWAYLRPASLRVLDRRLVVSGILWGNYARLKRAALDEIRAGQRVLQAACVYGDLSPDLAAWVGAEGRLDVVDVAPIQVANCRRKLAAFSNACARRADAAAPGGGPYDVVCCFFLLHEIPDEHKGSVVDGLLASVAPGGKVVFVDYHRPHRLHPLRLPTGLVFDLLEPFARTLWQREIQNLAGAADRFVWRKHTYFGGLYQKVVAEASAPAPIPGVRSLPS
jgi:SAM-dependent methyltransferase